MWQHMSGLMGSWMLLWWIAGIVFLLTVVWLLADAARKSPVGPPDSAEDILKRRYARGEIDHDEYERRLTDLRR